uniref:TIR domain-containing protein n=1 Tax=uncultured Thiotrichaceae bacterium TaxID=298394 RepID=A0A6S6SNX4_9GAMM|nr:MAG: Unknown protein [uncultured Thiotrichaceae bacterium]
MQRTVFVSYVQKDSEHVQQAVDLLEAGGATVFRGVAGIESGDDREGVITRTLRECERVMIFWSANAKTSEWVRKEYTIALEQQKRIVPVSLDYTPLPPELRKYPLLTNFMSQDPGWKKYGGWVVGAAALALLVVVLALPSFQNVFAPSSELLVAESVEMPVLAEVQSGEVIPNSIDPIAVDSVSGPAETPDPASIVPLGGSRSLPIFAWGAGLLSLLLLLLLWLRSRSETMIVLDHERAGRQFVDTVFDEE